jgi:hypothetical protein
MTDDVGPGTPPTRVPSPARSEFLDVRTRLEAIDLIRELILRQIQRAQERRTPPNEYVDGDKDVKRAFFLLLDQPSQRELFVLECKKREFWPRIRTCIGAPPFSFLRSQDNDMLRAGGIAVGRINMSSETTISSTAEMSSGHFTDSNDRIFKVVVDDNTTSTEIPIVRARSAKRVVFDVKLPKMKLTERSAIFKRSHGKDGSITYPRVGERIALNPNPLLGGESLHVFVRTIQAKSQFSPVVRLYCTSV